MLDVVVIPESPSTYSNSRLIAENASFKKVRLVVKTSNFAARGCRIDLEPEKKKKKKP